MAVGIIAEAIDFRHGNTAVQSLPDARSGRGQRAHIYAAVVADQQPAVRIEGERPPVGVDGRAIARVGRDAIVVGERGCGICRGIDPHNRQRVDAAIGGEIIVAHDIDEIAAGRVDGEGEVQWRLTAAVDGGRGQRGPARARSVGIKQTVDLASAEVDQTDGQRSARACCDFECGLVRRVDQSAALGCREHRRPGRPAICAFIDSGLRPCAGAARRDGRIICVGIGRVADQRSHRT